MKPLVKRWIIVISILIFILCYTVFSLRLQTGFACTFYQLTGLYCPGCGLGRSVRHLFSGIGYLCSGEWQFCLNECWLAFRYNVLLMPCFLPGCLLLLYTAWQYITGIPYKSFLFIRIMERFGFWIGGILVVYGILRNVLVIFAPPC